MEETALGHRDLHVAVSGAAEAPPVVLLHGWGSSARIMHPLAAALAEDFHVYNLDWPGHGHSPPPPRPWGVEEHAGLLESFLIDRVREDHPGEPITLLGHSNGGRISLFLASDPKRARLVDRLVLVSPSGITPHRSWKTRLRAGTARALKAPFQVLPRPLREPALDWLRHTLLWRALGSSDYRQLQGVMRETFVKVVNTHVDERIHRIEAPTLIFWGDRDEAISRRQVETLEKGIPDAGLVVLEGASHYGFLDEPATVLTATRHFLRETTASRV